MPFKSKSQMRGAFSGALGPEMKKKAKQWAEETPNIKALPDKKKAKKDHSGGHHNVEFNYKKGS